MKGGIISVSANVLTFVVIVIVSHFPQHVVWRIRGHLAQLVRALR